MDLMYSRYSNPMEFMRSYINQGRFGEFVENIIRMENERRKKEEELEDDNKLWAMFIHSYSDKCFTDWKREVLKSDLPGKSRDEDLTDADILDIINQTFPGNEH